MAKIGKMKPPKIKAPKPRLTGILNLPLPVKAAIFMVSGGGLVGGLALLTVMFPRLGVVLWIATAAIGLVVFAYAFVLKRLDKGKSKPFEQKLGENSGATPAGVGDAAARARLDDMRRKFMDGINTFKDHGKDLYQMPWYALVGEPGSGKTEAIRHCNVGFPPGLQDQLQGAGGTLNMNWWFTNFAVILDTAGRLMFEEIQPGQTSEWKEFLKLLRSARPNCPINGMLLVIPADTLIRDSANEIEAKAGKIARQLDDIQRSLGVRFPVFVIVTKSDLINGFREFFDDLTDPVLQHQMLGWTNPAGLDTPFEPQAVEDHLASVRASLRKRRMRLLMDPVHTQDAKNGRRVDQVDSLYPFPDALMQIAPRLRRYLEMIFVAGEWSQKPLFLRGIYFTSSMREGSALDQDLADVLGVRVDALPEGKVWEKDRSYFLKDLFIEKVFREKGLVTRANNAERLKRRRGAVLMGSIIAAMVVMGALTWFGAAQLKTAIGDRADFWIAAEKYINGSEPELVAFDAGSDSGYAYSGSSYVASPGDPNTDFEVRGAPVSFVDIQHLAVLAANEEASTPLVFAWIAWISPDDPFANRRPAQRAMFERAVLKPATDMALRRLGEQRGWSAAATGALEQLLRLHASGVKRVDAEKAGDEGEPGRGFAVDPLLAFVLEASPTEIEKYRNAKHDKILQEVFEKTYGGAAPADAWPPDRLGVDDEGRRGEVREAVEGFIAYYADSLSNDETLLGRFGLLNKRIARFKELEDRLLNGPKIKAFKDVTTVAAYNESLSQWRADLKELTAAEAEIDASLASLSEVLEASGPRWERVKADVLDAAASAYERLNRALGPDAASGNDDGTREAFVAGLQTKLRAGQQALSENVDANLAKVREAFNGYYEAYLASRGAGLKRPFAVRMEMYRLADAALAREAADVALGSASRAFGELVEARSRTENEILNLKGTSAGQVEIDAAVVSQSALGAAYRRVAYESAVRVLEAIRSTPVEDLVSREAAALGTGVSLPSIPGSEGMAGAYPVEPKYEPAAARAVLSAIGFIAGLNAEGAGGVGVLHADEIAARMASLDAGVRSYVDRYVDYWTNTVVDAAMPSTSRIANWGAMLDLLAGVQVAPTNERLGELSKVIRDALQAGVDGLGVRATGEAATLRDRVTALQGAMARDLADRAQSTTFRDAVAGVVEAWVRVGRTPSDAARRVLVMTPSVFQDQYLGLGQVYARDGELLAPVQRYWHELLGGTLSQLVAANSNEAGAAYNRLTAANVKRFPLAIDGAGTVPVEEFQALAGLINYLPAGDTGRGAASLYTPESLGGGARGALPGGVSLKIQQLVDGGVPNAESVVRWAAKMRWLADRLGPQANLEWDLVWLNPALQRQQLERARFVEVRRGAESLTLTAPGFPAGTTRISDVIDPFVMARGFDLPQREGGLALVFYGTADADDRAALAEARLDGPWTGVAALAPRASGSTTQPRQYRRADQPVLPEGTDGLWVLEVPLTVPGEPGRPYQESGRPRYVYVGVVVRGADFPTDPEQIDKNWPRSADWP